ncbi:MAG: D-glycero-beta-D-manno-heptose 1,7-bisphosphate 7-phosphatase [Pyrinomonadaceae bacterium]
MKSRAVFLDRDGTISEEVGYLDDPSRFRLLPGSPAAIQLLNENGWKVVVVTNQSGVARGFFAEEMVVQVNELMRSKLAAAGARLDGVYYCPHHPTSGAAPYVSDCDCRKPKPGLLFQAAQELDIDLSASWMVGDRYGDVAVAPAAGVRSALVLTGYGRDEWEALGRVWKHEPELVAEDLLEVARKIVGKKAKQEFNRR